MKTFNIRYRSIEKLKDFLTKNGLIKEKNLLVQIFSDLSPSAFLTLTKPLQTLLPHAVVVGCSTDGEIINGKILVHNTVISITVFEKSQIAIYGLEREEDSFAQGKDIVQNLQTPKTKALILFATFSGLNAQDLLDGIYHDKKGEFVLSGALAADNGTFKSAFVFDGEKIYKEGIVAVALSGDSLYASNYFVHDWEPVSRKFTVNKVKNSRLLLLDNKVPKILYSQYVGAKKTDSLPLYALQFPFVLKEKNHYHSKPIMMDFKDGSLAFSASLKEGDVLQIAFANIDKVEENIPALFNAIAQNPAQTLFVYASSARRRFLEQLAIKEIDSLKNIATVSGFFGFGEFFANEKECSVLGQSLSVLALSENAEVKKQTFGHSFKKSERMLAYKTAKVLSNIAQTSSYELGELNKKLKARVQEEVNENRKKDSIMIHNSKLAQLGEMLGLIVHQWRQPLSAISATASGMQIKFELETWNEAYVKSSLEHIEEYVTHLSETINDFTDFFKPSKKMHATLVRDIIKKALFIMSPLLTKESILVVKKYGSENMLQTYPNEVAQVILNLVKNSVNALLKREVKNPEIYINEYYHEGKNIIEISDNAEGIDPAIIEHIFEPYFSTKESEESMGLGLYMSKFIIQESCGGSLEVENIEDGVKFTITLNAMECLNGCSD